MQRRGFLKAILAAGATTPLVAKGKVLADTKNEWLLGYLEKCEKRNDHCDFVLLNDKDDGVMRFTKEAVRINKVVRHGFYIYETMSRLKKKRLDVEYMVDAKGIIHIRLR